MKLLKDGTTAKKRETKKSIENQQIKKIAVMSLFELFVFNSYRQ
jgi:hypothetical protein